MGRVRSLLCAFCLDKGHADGDSYGRTNDVSHLATPHVCNNRRSASSTPVYDNGDEIYSNTYNGDQSQNLIDTANRINPTNDVHIINRPPTQEANMTNSTNSPAQHSPSISSQSPPISSQPQPAADNFHNSDHDNVPQAYDNIEQVRARPSNDVENNNGPVCKLSYDIISVREPLAKILANRHQLNQSQQRQAVSEHEYIEVYGERGSSCFYEEIAGSTTSSATYDQIGAVSNHNYQVLVNAYAVLGENEAGQSNQVERPNYVSARNSNDGGSEVEQPHNASECAQPSSPRSTSTTTDQIEPHPSGSPGLPAAPVYSVINKATRKTNSKEIDSRQPPRPPPKNASLISQQGSTSAIQHLSERSSPLLYNRNSPNIIEGPATSSYNYTQRNFREHSALDMPEPPPRISQQLIFNVNSNRPLPLPGSQGYARDCDDDVDTASNGYELVGPTFEDDQVDVGYEKIRDTDRYSGGSMASQFYNLQVHENGYESVHSIYSSPSNALVEPKYEAIGSATASEIAASATARLNAAAKVIDQDK